MEKEKKIEKKVQPKKTVKKEVVEENFVIEKNEKSLVRFIALLSSFFATGMAILIFIFGVISTISTLSLSKEELLTNNIVVTFVSKMNGYSILESKDLIDAMSNRTTFAIFEVIIPAIAFIGAMILIIVLGKRLTDFVNDVKYEKDLYTHSKLESLQDIISILSVILLATLVIFNKPSIIIYLLIDILLLIIYLLFKKCVLMQKK